MKKLIKLTLVVALVLGSSSLFAQKLGRINLEEIITLMPEYKEMMTNMEAYSKDLRDNLETIQVELNTKYNDFQKNKATYSEVTRQLKEKELTDLQNRLQEFYQSAQEDLQKKEKELTDPIVAKAQEAVKKVAQKGAYVAVFNHDHPLDGLLRRGSHDRFEHRSQGRAGDSINGNASTTKRRPLRNSKRTLYFFQKSFPSCGNQSSTYPSPADTNSVQTNHPRPTAAPYTAPAAAVKNPVHRPLRPIFPYRHQNG